MASSIITSDITTDHNSNILVIVHIARGRFFRQDGQNEGSFVRVKFKDIVQVI